MSLKLTWHRCTYKGQIDCQHLIEQMKCPKTLKQADLLYIEQEKDGTQAVQQQELQNQREVCNFWSFVRRLFGT
jgi:hypothetical protein